MARRSTAPSAVVVGICWQRAGGICERCCRGIRFSDRGIGWSLHHREARGMGGAKQAYVNQPSNLLVLCGSGVTGCHGWVESNRERALELGLLVSRHGVRRPIEIPVTLSAVEYWLDDFGGKVSTHDSIPF